MQKIRNYLPSCGEKQTWAPFLFAWFLPGWGSLFDEDDSKAKNDTDDVVKWEIITLKPPEKVATKDADSI